MASWGEIKRKIAPDRDFSTVSGHLPRTRGTSAEPLKKPYTRSHLFKYTCFLSANTANYLLRFISEVEIRLKHGS